MFTTVTNASFITGPLCDSGYRFLVCLLGHAYRAGNLWAAHSALVGMLLLSVNADYSVRTRRLAATDRRRLLGNFTLLLVVRVGQRYGSAVRVAFVQFVVCRAVSLSLALIFETHRWAGIVLAGPAIL